MKREYFGELMTLSMTNPAIVSYRSLVPQERDWSCSVACLRCLLSNCGVNMSEDSIIHSMGLKKGPHYSKELSEWHGLKDLNLVTPEDAGICASHCAEQLYELVLNGYGVMVNTMINYDHWIVIIGVFPNGSRNIDSTRVLYYDPYFNEEKLIRLEELCSMWMSGDYANNGVCFDYLAIKPSNEREE